MTTLLEESFIKSRLNFPSSLQDVIHGTLHINGHRQCHQVCGG
jgi:hypothetical protein